MSVFGAAAAATRGASVQTTRAAVGALAAASSLVVACAGASGAPASAGMPGSSSTPSSPVAAPRPGILGCVESRELKDYVLALDARRQAARREALEASGSMLEERRGAFGAAGPLALDESYEVEGRRFVVAAERVPHAEPRVALARQGSLLRRIDERPRAHAVDVLVCGVERCARPGSGERVAVRPLVVELMPGESWAGSLELVYDYWWARVRYDEREACPTNVPSRRE